MLTFSNFTYSLSWFAIDGVYKKFMEGVKGMKTTQERHLDNYSRQKVFSDMVRRKPVKETYSMKNKPWFMQGKEKKC